MCNEELVGEAHGIGDGFLTNAPAIAHDGIPVVTIRYLIQDIADQYASSLERELPVTDHRTCEDIASEADAAHLGPSWSSEHTSL